MILFGHVSKLPLHRAMFQNYRSQRCIWEVRHYPCLKHSLGAAVLKHDEVRSPCKFSKLLLSIIIIVIIITITIMIERQWGFNLMGRCVGLILWFLALKGGALSRSIFDQIRHVFVRRILQQTIGKSFGKRSWALSFPIQAM